MKAEKVTVPATEYFVLTLTKEEATLLAIHWYCLVAGLKALEPKVCFDRVAMEIFVTAMGDAVNEAR